MNNEDNIPHDDEDLGGFEAHDDDSFALEHLEEYPGDLSKFKESAVSLEKSAEMAINTTSEATTEIPSVENNQQKKQPNEDDIEQISGGSSYRSALGEGVNNQGIPFKRSGFDSEFDSGQNSSEQTVLDKNNSDTTKPVAQEFEKIDDEWVQLLKNDVERSKERKTSSDKQPQTEPDVNSSHKKEFTSVEDLGTTDEININEIEAHHPSTYLLQGQEELEITPEPELEFFEEEPTPTYSSYATLAADMASTQVPKPVVEPVIPPPTPTIPKPIKPKNEKRRKRIIYFMISAAALAAIGYGAFLFYPTVTAFLNPNPSVTIPLATHESPKVHAKVEEQLKDSVTAEVMPSTDSIKEGEHAVVSEPISPAKHEKISHTSPKVEISHKISEPINEIPKKVEPTITKSVLPTKTVTHNNSSVFSSEPTQQIFTVQVYSSPSKDDANERLDRLKSRNATNISMSEQLIRGTKWYRVRFGSFHSREEAESAAKQLGFAQCWIDRVR